MTVPTIARGLLAALALLLPAPARADAASVPPPAGWPSSALEIGVRDPEHGAADLRARGRFGARYHYLSGGVRTGRSWTTWATGGGSFVTGFIEDSVAHGFLPVFSLYHLRESAPGDAIPEAESFEANLHDAETMRAYFDDLRVFFERAAATRTTVVLHVEPDMWGYLQRSGERELARSFARRVVAMRDELARNVLLGYHLSTWGTGEDPVFSDPSDARVDELARSSAAFYGSLDTPFDLVVAEYADRDAGYREHVDGDGGAAHWDAGDFDRHVRYLATFGSLTRKRILLWQVPLGNSRLPDERDRYRDNKVETLLDPGRAGRDLRRRYADAGVLAILFGHALPGATTDRTDGGLFDRLARAYYARGPLRLPGATRRPPAASKTRTVAPRMRISTSIRRRVVRRPGTATVDVRIRPGEAARVLVAVQIFAPGATRPTYQVPFRGQALRRGVHRRLRARFRIPSSARPGTWRVKVGVFDPDWKRLLVWRDRAGSVRVR